MEDLHELVLGQHALLASREDSHQDCGICVLEGRVEGPHDLVEGRAVCTDRVSEKSEGLR